MFTNIKILHVDVAMISEHEKQEIAEAYKEEGLREGFDKGVEKGKLEDAKAMKTLGYAAIDIQKVTGLSLEVIAGL